MDSNTVGSAIIGIVLLVLAAKSGVLFWAILAGITIGLVALFVLRDWKASSTVGAFVAVVISAFGIAAMVVPGWYKELL